MNNMMASPRFENTSNFLYVATHQIFRPLLQAVPKPIKSRNDLRKVGFIRGFGREQRVSTLYNKAKDVLFDLDKEVANFASEIIKMEVPQLRNELISYLDHDYPKFKSLHKSFLELKDVLSWVNDDYLLSTFLFHLKLSENFVFAVNVPKMKGAVKGDLSPVVESISHLQDEEKDYIKAIIVLTLDTLLIWGALEAKIRRDNDYILSYEENVSNAARTLARTKPEVARKMSGAGAL
jgi:hypothetical protein